MGAKEGRPDAVREQVANVLRKAQAVVGGREVLAERVDVAPHKIGEWIAKIGDCPDEVVRAATEIILKHWEKGEK